MDRERDSGILELLSGGPTETTWSPKLSNLQMEVLDEAGTDLQTQQDEIKGLTGAKSYDLPTKSDLQSTGGEAQTYTTHNQLG